MEASDHHFLIEEDDNRGYLQRIRKWLTRNRIIGLSIAVVTLILTIILIATIVTVQVKKHKTGSDKNSDQKSTAWPTITSPEITSSSSISPTTSIPTSTPNTTANTGSTPTTTTASSPTTSPATPSPGTPSPTTSSPTSSASPTTTTPSPTSPASPTTTTPSPTSPASPTTTTPSPTSPASPTTTTPTPSTIVTTTSTPLTTTPIPTSQKLECVASQTDEGVCTRSGCVWEESEDPDVPNCLLPEDDKFGFKVSAFDVESESFVLTVSKGSFFGGDFKSVIVKVEEIDENIVRIRFTEDGKDRYQVPIELNSKSKRPEKNNLVYDVKISYSFDDLFSFQVMRKEDKTVIFDSSVGSLFLAERHIEVTTKLPSKNVYGIGESTHKKFKHDLNFNKWPLFSRDQPPDPWDGAGRYNLYGVHPYYTCLEDSGKSHGVLFLNSNAMEFTLTPMPALNFRSSGGILDMFFFVGDNPEHVTQLYTQVIGRPMIPPYWGLGFQLSHYGFNTLDNMNATITRTRNKGFPLDVVHADIDLMDENEDFTWDNERFSNFSDFVNYEKGTNGLRLIIILDPAVLANNTNYKPYKTGEDNDVYVKWPDYIPAEKRNNPPNKEVNVNKGIMFGRVWPNGPVAFPDFFKNATHSWWKKNIKDYRERLAFDALWIDMNEPSCFGTDQEEPWFCPANDKKCWALKCPENPYDNPNNTFIPAATSVYSNTTKLSDKTICMAAVQGNKGEFVHYDVHNLYGWSETESTYRALADTAKGDQIPLVISRSTYPSSGRHAGHWLGDNYSTWRSMQSSIIGMLEFNLFGIPYIGADICGFALNSTSELCGRWMQVGAFYPFCRNHNALGSIDQDPGSKLLNDRDRERARAAISTRYQLLPYLHTLHYKAHTFGNTVVRPLFHEFPTDPRTYDIQEQFMWGSSLLISPVLYENTQILEMYLPEDLWFDFHNGTVVSVVEKDRKISVSDLEIVSLHVRGGSILPLKAAGANSTRSSRQLDFEIRVYPKNGVAEGDLFWMAEEAKDFKNDSFFRLYHFQLNQSALVITFYSEKAFEIPNKQVIGKVIVFDQDKKPNNVTYEEKKLNQDSFSYEEDSKSLQISLSIDLETLTKDDRTRTIKWS